MMLVMDQTLLNNFNEIKKKIARAAEKSGRTADDVKLVAVSKTQPVEVIRAAVDSGITVFGENKAQEAEIKIESLENARAEWHLIGHLQSNKARKAVRLFDMIHTVDSVELAERIERISTEENRPEMPVLIQVDLAGEETKSGVPESGLPELVRFVNSCDAVKLKGFMILPPFFDDEEKARPFFQRLRKIRDEILPGGELSMGMSGDFEAAVEEGATIVRVGTAIFGDRRY